MNNKMYINKLSNYFFSLLCNWIIYKLIGWQVLKFSLTNKFYLKIISPLLYIIHDSDTVTKEDNWKNNNC